MPCARHRDSAGSAAGVGARTVELHPYQHIARVVYAEALRGAQRFTEALAQYRQAVLLSPDVPWLRALEGACLADVGRVDEARACAGELAARRQHEYVDAYHMAALRLALGDHEGAAGEVARAFDDNSAWLYALDVDPKMAPLRGDRRVRRLVDRRLSPP
jgi:Flp pilus assembly protein TadD